MPAVPLNAELGLEGVVTEPPEPLTMLQLPVPVVGALPARVVEVPQMFWFGPAFAAVGFAVNVMFTSSVEAAQGALLIVHLKV